MTRMTLSQTSSAEAFCARAWEGRGCQCAFNWVEEGREGATTCGGEGAQDPGHETAVERLGRAPQQRGRVSGSEFPAGQERGRGERRTLTPPSA